MMPRWRWSPGFFFLWIMAAMTYSAWAARARLKTIKQEDWEITCFTCVNVSNNYGCNRHAVDRPCPKGTDYCHTSHILDSDGSSVLVTKKCAKRTDCRQIDVGCFDETSKPGLTKCVACCDMQYCNEFIPTNESTAVLISTRLANRANNLQHLNLWLTACFTLLVPAICHQRETQLWL